MMEILAPAGAWPQLEAAVRSGADAVYLGTQNLNARMKAGNFDNLKDAVSYCHLRNVRVYVTVNTLIRQDELPLVLDTLEEVAASGADAMLVTDMGTVRLARKACPGMKLHASTQMTVHNLSGALLMRDLGFSRVVLAREMTRDEIEYVTAHAGIETEVFVHGAHCMSISGQCLLSSFWGQRSGNRGRCAQPCRLNFKSSDREYALSLKDLSLCEYLKDLEELGVSSAKIEGRLKRPEYVSAAVKACTAYREGRTPDMEQLKQVFSRDGFTQGFYLGKRNLAMFGRRDQSDENPDSLSKIRDNYRTERQSVPVFFSLYHQPEGSIRIVLNDGSHLIEETIPSDPAIRNPLPREAAEKALYKLGGTPFRTDLVTADSPDGFMCRSSDINRAKGTLIDKLTLERSAVVPVAFSRPALTENPYTAPAKEKLFVFLSHFSQWSEELEKPGITVFLPAEEMTDAFIKAHPGVGARLFPFCFGNEDQKQLEMLLKLKDAGLVSVSVGNPGGIYAAQQAGLECHGEYTLGIMNSQAAEQYRALGLVSYDLSVETGLGNCKNVFEPSPGLLIYGKIPLMNFRTCPIGHCEKCSGRENLQDRYGQPFQLMCHQKKIIQLLNPHPLYWGDLKDNLPPLDHYSVLFTLESKEECLKILQACHEGAPWAGNYTRGLYNKQLL